MQIDIKSRARDIREMKTSSIVIFSLMMTILMGCQGNDKHKPLQKETDPSKPQTKSEATVYSDVQPLFRTHCSSCHKEGSGLPVWTNYEETKRNLKNLIQ